MLKLRKNCETLAFEKIKPKMSSIGKVGYRKEMFGKTKLLKEFYLVQILKSNSQIETFNTRKRSRLI